MKFGIRVPSLKKRISARISPKRYIRHNLGVKMPRGYGFITNPKKAVYNRIYNRTSVGIDKLFKTANVKRSSAGHSAENSAINVSLSLLFSFALAIILLFIFWPLGIGYIVYKIFRLWRKKNDQKQAFDEAEKDKFSVEEKDSNTVSDFHKSDPDNPKQEGKCPYCGQIIIPFPVRGKKCAVCKKKYRVRTFPDEKTPRIIKEEDLPALEDLWAKHLYIREAGDDTSLTTENDEVTKLIKEAKIAFKNGKRDEAWGLYNKATLEATKGEYFTGEQYLSKQWLITRSMAIQLMAEEKYANAATTLCRIVIIDVVCYSQENDSIFYIAPVTLSMISEAIQRGKIAKVQFLEFFNQSVEATNHFIKYAKAIDKEQSYGLDSIKDIDTNELGRQIVEYAYSETEK